MELEEFNEGFLGWAVKPAVFDWLEAGHRHLQSRLEAEGFIDASTVTQMGSSSGQEGTDTRWYRLYRMASRGVGGPQVPFHVELRASWGGTTHVEMGWLGRHDESHPLALVKVVAVLEVKWPRVVPGHGERSLSYVVQKAPSLASDEVIARLMNEFYKAFSH